MFFYLFKLVNFISDYISNKLFTQKIGDLSYKDMEPKFKIHRHNRIDIYNFTEANEYGNYDRSNFIELPPTNKSYNLIDSKGSCKKIYVNSKAIQNPHQKEVIENTIRIVLTNLNMADECSKVKILKDGTLLVSSDDWSEEHK